jgi:acetate kinase
MHAAYERACSPTALGLDYAGLVLLPGARMVSAPNRVLTVNGGSTSIKFALIDMEPAERRVLSGSLDEIGEPTGSMHVVGLGGTALVTRSLSLRDHRSALGELLDWLEHHKGGHQPDAVGHRVVHGGAELIEPVRITDSVIDRLQAVADLAPDHLPRELAAIAAIHHDFPHVPQVAAFDTAFHTTITGPAATFPLPRRLTDEGVRRYGFHGLSCEYIMQELSGIPGVETSRRIIIAHLGGGASMTAVHDGKSIDTTMGLTPLGGLMMGTRTGDLDPGVLIYLLRRDAFDVAELDTILNHESGMLGVSGISADMQELLGRQSDSPEAAAAIDQFVYIARKHLAGLITALGGLDILVFTGGIGEHAPEIRRRISDGLAFAGIEIDTKANLDDAAVVSTGNSAATVRVIHTDEELMVARHTRAVLDPSPTEPRKGDTHD